jgi:hypothetical protein
MSIGARFSFTQSDGDNSGKGDYMAPSAHLKEIQNTKVFILYIK